MKKIIIALLTLNFHYSTASDTNEKITIDDGFEGISCNLIPIADGTFKIEISTTRYDSCKYNLGISRTAKAYSMQIDLKEDLPDNLDCDSSSDVESSSLCGVQIGATSATIQATMICEAADSSPTTKCGLLKLCRSRITPFLSEKYPEKTVSLSKNLTGGRSGNFVSKVTAVEMFDKYVQASGCP
ncbi:MAG: hypothetical protein AABY53_08725 [Bdellovibrionota bacterium]